MNKSSIVVRTKYRHTSEVKKQISKWNDYVSKKEKAESTSLDEKNILSEYFSLADKESFLHEKCESYVWGEFGDINLKQFMKDNLIDDTGYIWNLVISFPPDFALNNGLITKSDYFDLTKNIMPSLIADMGLKVDNVCWFSSLHINTDNPHTHIVMFEKHKTASTGFIPKFAIHNMKSNIGSYLIDNKEFYKLRDREFSKITGGISLKELTKVQKQKLYSDKYRKDLNKMLLEFYATLPKIGRLQYNSKNMKPYKSNLDIIISYILSHDSIKYNYANYLKLLDKHQKELNSLYGTPKDNNVRKYYNDQVNRLYTKIGNEILNNFKIYNSMSVMDRELSFLSKHIKDLKFKSRSYVKTESKYKIAKELYRLCVLSGLNYEETKKVFEKWIKNSKYVLDIDLVINGASTSNVEMSSTDYYKALKSLGYTYDRYNKLKNKYFYKELHYKKFVNEANKHLISELEKEEKEIIAEMQYELTGY